MTETRRVHTTAALHRLRVHQVTAAEAAAEAAEAAAVAAEAAAVAAAADTAEAAAVLAEATAEEEDNNH